jgi:hypothetical protein
MSAIRAAVDWTLQRHEPYPAIAFDRHWVLVALNNPAATMLATVGLRVGESLLEALLAPDRFRAAITNWPEVAAHMRARLRTESRHLGGDPILERAAEALASEMNPPREAGGILPAILSTTFAVGGVALSFFSTIAQFGSADDIALADLKIELLFPADEATRHVLCSGQ